MMRRLRLDQMVILGIKGTVLALDAATGAGVWRTPLKGCYFTNITLDGGRILASTRGEVFCLDAASGRVLWHNPLKGMGWGLVTFATGSQIAALAQQIDDTDRTTAATAAT